MAVARPPPSVNPVGELAPAPQALAAGVGRPWSCERLGPGSEGCSRTSPSRWSGQRGAGGFDAGVGGRELLEQGLVLGGRCGGLVCHGLLQALDFLERGGARRW